MMNIEYFVAPKKVFIPMNTIEGHIKIEIVRGVMTKILKWV